MPDKNKIGWCEARGILFILSAPSGAGKTTLAKHLVENVADLRQSVSYTTRTIRPNEVDGRDYHFITQEKFDEMVKGGEFAEYAHVHGRSYGTSFDSIRKACKEGYDLLLVIDVQGAAQLREKDIDQISIFLLPPSLQELRKRLGGRGSDSQKIVEKRLAVAKEEIAQCANYDYLVVNDDLETSKRKIESIIFAGRCKQERKKLTFPDFELPASKEEL